MTASSRPTKCVTMALRLVIEPAASLVMFADSIEKKALNPAKIPTTCSEASLLDENKLQNKKAQIKAKRPIHVKMLFVVPT